MSNIPTHLYLPNGFECSACDAHALMQNSKLGYLEHLFESLLRISSLSTFSESAQISQLLELFSIRLPNHVQSEVYLSVEAQPYNKSNGYRGYFFGLAQGGSLTYIIGDPAKTITFIKPLFDREEIQRLANKWQKSNIKSQIILQYEDAASHRNNLRRVLTSKMDFVGLLGQKML